MNKLSEFARLSAAVGVRKGESAKSLRGRDKAAADALAQFVRGNHAGMTRAMTRTIVAK